MVVAVAKAVEEARGDHLRLDRQHLGVGRGLRRGGGLRGLVVLAPRARSPSASCCQAMAAGARVVAVDGNFDDALGIVREMASDDHPVTLVNSVNPSRLEGQKTAAFEVCDDLGGAPDFLAIPVGNAGNISAYWAGFRDVRAGRPSSRPGHGHARASRPPGRRRSSSASRSTSRRRSPPPSGSATRRRGRPRSRPATSPAG